MLFFLLVYFLSGLLPDLPIYSFQNRPVPSTGQGHRRRPNMALVFSVNFML